MSQNYVSANVFFEKMKEMSLVEVNPTEKQKDLFKMRFLEAAKERGIPCDTEMKIYLAQDRLGDMVKSASLVAIDGWYQLSFMYKNRGIDGIEKKVDTFAINESNKFSYDLGEALGTFSASGTNIFVLLAGLGDWN